MLDRKGVRFGFLAYTFDQRNGNHTDDDARIAMMDLRRMTTEVAALRKKSDVVVVSTHAGTEYSPKPNGQQMQFARAAIDSGATILVGHHPHVVQPVERYKDGIIFYSLGNLVFDQDSPGAVADITFRGTKLESHTLREVTMHNTVPHWK